MREGQDHEDPDGRRERAVDGRRVRDGTRRVPAADELQAVQPTAASDGSTPRSEDRCDARRRAAGTSATKSRSRSRGSCSTPPMRNATAATPETSIEATPIVIATPASPMSPSVATRGERTDLLPHRARLRLDAPHLRQRERCRFGDAEPVQSSPRRPTTPAADRVRLTDSRFSATSVPIPGNESDTERTARPWRSGFPARMKPEDRSAEQQQREERKERAIRERGRHESGGIGAEPAVDVRARYPRPVASSSTSPRRGVLEPFL